MVVHWAGGRHTELRVQRPKSGEHGRRTDTEALEIIKQMAGQFPDELIAATLNRLGLKTGAGNPWKKNRVCSLRKQTQPAHLRSRCAADDCNGCPGRPAIGNRRQDGTRASATEGDSGETDRPICTLADSSRGAGFAGCARASAADQGRRSGAAADQPDTQTMILPGIE